MKYLLMVRNLGEIVHLFRVSDFPCWKLIEAGVVILFISNHCKSYPEVWVYLYLHWSLCWSIITYLWPIGPLRHICFHAHANHGIRASKFQYSFTGSTNMMYIIKDKGNMYIVFSFLVFSNLNVSCADGRAKSSSHSR